ncbi:Far7p SCDLUD_000835 [Saccharomycodes ludwigii]|uniref:Far7p n=1 Tax=Saccharomycodes ludwigii TaxID=36035 RepID=UPI001E8611F6|nr:hypothetical protein SCDLUD_000835 [Saccharomycodes ludwigii]KAH3903216.1 hypothetical protein SCDLUD_000835 [Saccharomycodes ludwigii]
MSNNAADNSNNVTANTNAAATNQQILYMNPQTEDLTQLYELMNNLKSVLSDNEKRRNNVLKGIDLLSYTLMREQDKEGTSNVNNKTFQRDINNFDLFIKNCGKKPTIVKSTTDTLNSDSLFTLTQQNKQLKEILEITESENNQYVHVLSMYNNGLSDIIKLLRTKIYRQNIELYSKLSQTFKTQLFDKQDIITMEYLNGIDDYTILLEISDLYRALLVHLDDYKKKKVTL